MEMAGGRLRDEGEVARSEVSAPSSGGWGREREIESTDHSQNWAVCGSEFLFVGLSLTKI